MEFMNQLEIFIKNMDELIKNVKIVALIKNFMKGKL